MKNRRYIVDDTPILATWLELVDYNLKEDVEQLTQDEIVHLTTLRKGKGLVFGHCEVRRVI